MKDNEPDGFIAFVKRISLKQQTRIQVEVEMKNLMMIQRKTFEESIGIAIYSNNELKVSASLTLFETLWIQSEFEKQNQIEQACFQIFKGLELKDESNVRRWSFEQQDQNKELM